MTATAEIVNYMFRSGRIKKLLSPFTFSEDPDRDRELRSDFEQDIILILLEYKNQNKIIDMYAKKQLSYFILGIIKRNIYSRNSPYYRNYVRYNNNKVAFTYDILNSELNGII